MNNKQTPFGIPHICNKLKDLSLGPFWYCQTPPVSQKEQEHQQEQEQQQQEQQEPQPKVF